MEYFQIIEVVSNGPSSTSIGNSNFTVSLNVDRGKRFDRISILQCNIPKSYYLVAAGYNTFVLVEGSNNTTITVPPGNYNNLSLPVVLVSLLNAATTIGATYTCTYPNVNTTADTGKYTYGTSSSTSTKFMFNGLYGINLAMGFNINSTNTFVSKSLISTNYANMQNVKTLNIICNLVSENGSSILLSLQSSILPSGCDIAWQTTDPIRWSRPLILPDTNAFTFYLVDEYNQTVYLNGLSYTMELILFRSSRFKEIVQTYINMRHLQIKNKENIEDKLKEYEKASSNIQNGEFPGGLHEGRNEADNN